jgi:regulator of replication initiation timing
MPTFTKAQLAQQVADLKGENADLKQQVRDLHEESEERAKHVVELKQENEDLKKRVRRGCDRSRSPRRPTTGAEASQAMTSMALHQVSLWQGSTLVKEQRDEIQRLHAAMAEKDAQIASLRRGEGPLGEVLAHNDALNVARYNFQRSPEYAASVAAGFAKETMSVGEGFEKVMKIFTDGYSFIQRGSHR